MESTDQPYLDLPVNQQHRLNQRSQSIGGLRTSKKSSNRKLKQIRNSMNLNIVDNERAKKEILMQN